MVKKGEFIDFAANIPDKMFDGIPTHMQIIVELSKKIIELEARILKLENKK